MAKIVEVFREVRRVLRKDGTVWLNLGDSYAGSGQGWQKENGSSIIRNWLNDFGFGFEKPPGYISSKQPNGLKPKDLIGIPWRVAFALQADGWWLRQDVIWAKCLSGGTLVYAKTQKGEMPMTIKDMVRLDPTTVQLWNGTKWTNIVGWKEVEPDIDRKHKGLRTRSARYRGKESVVEGDIEIELRNGQKIGCTKEHRWPTNRGIVAAKYLKVGDVIQSVQLPESSRKTPVHLPDSIGWLIGTYLADGSKGKDGKVLQFASNLNEKERFETLKKFADEYGGTCQMHQTSENGATINVYSRVLSGVIDTYINGNSAKTKHLSTNCWQRSNQFLSELLKGYLSGDGHYDKKNDRWILGFANNDNLAQDLRAIASRLNYSLRLHRVIHKCNGQEFPGWKGNLIKESNRRRCPDTEIVSIRQSRARKFWDIAVEDAPNLFALACGVLTHNSNPIPESVTDRCTKSHEYLFLLTKSARYYYDNIAILEPAAYDGRNDTVFKGSTKYDADTLARLGGERWPNKIPKNLEDDGQQPNSMHIKRANGEGEPEPTGYVDGVPARNKRSVWTIPTSPYKGAHYATFPPALVEPCILAGTSAKGCCPKCGAPWERVVEYEENESPPERRMDTLTLGFAPKRGSVGSLNSVDMATKVKRHIKWQPTCTCDAGEPVPCTVLDPFSGTAVTGIVAIKHQREYIGIELNPKSNELAKKRLHGTQIKMI